MASVNSTISTHFASSTARASNSSGFPARRPSGHSGAVASESLIFRRAPQLQGNAPALLLGVIGDRASSVEQESRELKSIPKGRRASFVAALRSGVRGMGRRLSEQERLLAEAATIQQQYDHFTLQLNQARATSAPGSRSGRGPDADLQLYDALVKRSSCVAEMADLRLRCTLAEMPEEQLPVLQIDLEHRNDLQVWRLLT